MSKDRLYDNRRSSRAADSVLVQRILGTMPLPTPEEEAEAAFNSIMRSIAEGSAEPPACLDLPFVWASSVISSGRVVRCPKADDETA